MKSPVYILIMAAMMYMVSAFVYASFDIATYDKGWKIVCAVLFLIISTIILDEGRDK